MLSSGTDTEPHCPPSLRHSCPLKTSDRFKDNELTKTILATYQDLHDQHRKLLCRGVKEIAEAELKLAKEDMQKEIIAFLVTCAENIIIIKESYDDNDPWSHNLCKREIVALICEQTIKRTNQEDLKLLPFNFHSDMTQVLYNYLNLSELTVNGKINNNDKEKQHRLAWKVSVVFLAATSSIFRQQLEERRQRKLQAALKVYNDCIAQDKVNQDVEMAIEKEKEQ